MKSPIRLQAMADIPKGAIVVQYGISFVVQSINDGPRTIGTTRREIKAGETVRYNPAGDTSDIRIKRKRTTKETTL